jgi:hypothetical protein
MNKFRILIISGTIRQNVIFGILVCVCVYVCVCVCVCVVCVCLGGGGGWSCLKLLTVGFVRFRMDLILRSLVRCKLNYVQHLLITD